MIFTEHERDKIASKNYDLCIIGAGIMGLVIANELKNAGISVCVVESGNSQNNLLTESAKTVQSEKLQIRTQSRERGLGGSSQTWGGLTGLFDEWDLDTHEHIDSSGWPIEYSELMEYVSRSASKYQFPKPEMFSDKTFLDTELLKGSKSLTGELFIAPTKPLRFGDVFKGLFQGELMDLVSGATVLKLSTDKLSRSVNCAELAFEPGESIRVWARYFVLATGGIENPRILLNSDELGNERDQVGRYFMNHPKGFSGRLDISDSSAFTRHFIKNYGTYKKYVGITLSPEFRNNKKLLHPYIQLQPVYPWDESKGFVFWMEMKKKEVRQNPPSFLELIRGLVLMVLYYLHIVTNLRVPIHSARLLSYIDMAPQPENRIVLSNTSDLFGIPHAKLDAEIGELDLTSLSSVHAELKDFLIKKKVGVLHSVDISDVSIDASHHMGATRMGSDPNTSVVDRNLKLHFWDNVYIAGTSVLPTGGNANPTLIAVALTVRLADHLKTRFVL